MKIVIGILIGVLLIFLLTGLALWTGAFDTAATRPVGRIEEKVATLALNRSLWRRAPKMTNPVPASAETLREGLAHFRANCVVCHGAPGVDASEFGEGLNPPAPDLTTVKVQARPDGQMYWIVSEGIRMTGMPAFSGTHDRDEIWKIVAFLRHLPELTPREESSLREAVAAFGHHHEGESAPAGRGPDGASGAAPHH